MVELLFLLSIPIKVFCLKLNGCYYFKTQWLLKKPINIKLKVKGSKPSELLWKKISKNKIL